MPQINKILEQPNVLDGVGAHKIKITGGGVTIEGSLQQDIEISFNPEYKKLSELMVIPIQGIEDTVAAVAGGQLFGGITTEKMYTNASYIEVSITMRVIDTDGSGAPLEYAKMLAGAVQPKEIGDKQAKKSFEALVSTLEKLGKNAKSALNKAIKIYKDGDEDAAWYESLYDTVTGNNEALKNIPGDIWDSLIDFIKDKPLGDIEGFFEEFKAIYEKNRCMKVEISNYLCFKEMVIESLAQSFSQQQGFKGPLFADFTMQFSTRRVPNSEKVKEFYKTDATYKSRVTYEGSTS
jgi:hypothetical protein|tara:strand:- start:2395 stop:3273 length:879 start_codon:yes stop_codon:yes gene_type:complete